jgi:hypothetical protein
VCVCTHTHVRVCACIFLHSPSTVTMNIFTAFSCFKTHTHTHTHIRIITANAHFVCAAICKIMESFGKVLSNDFLVVKWYQILLKPCLKLFCACALCVCAFTGRSRLSCSYFEDSRCSDTISSETMCMMQNSYRRNARRSSVWYTSRGVKAFFVHMSFKIVTSTKKENEQCHVHGNKWETQDFRVSYMRFHKCVLKHRAQQPPSGILALKSLNVSEGFSNCIDVIALDSFLQPCLCRSKLFGPAVASAKAGPHAMLSGGLSGMGKMGWQSPQSSLA